MIHFPDGTTLFQIQARRAFSDVKEGELGGYVQFEKNLSQKGDCWIYDEAKATGESRVLDNAVLRDNAWLHGKAEMTENACMNGDTEAYGKAKLSGDAILDGEVWVYGDAEIGGNTRLTGIKKLWTGKHFMPYEGKDKPSGGVKYYAKGLFRKDVEQHTWNGAGDPVDQYLLKAGKLFLTEEAARISLLK